ncbi:MAG: LAGLIDADG family homing endonuclease, partial [Candidatus Thermoplasmatota archaeon]|nr:LAGLIDADG family homing endonuclease [Candidatus Thermoplasmatota archaeon]
VRKFYHFLNDFSLKAVAPFLGINIKDRVILTPSQMEIDDRTLRYNKHDVQEQLGVTLNLIQQTLPLAFTTGMTFDMLLSSGAVNMWDHMALIRGAFQKKIMPPICRVMSISHVLLRDFKWCNTKEDIVKQSKMKKDQLAKDFVRVVKYGDEMPKWMEDPYVIYNEKAKDSDERLNYHMPGGMTIKPDKEAFSHFIPWWHVVVADVGAMYPTILKAMNVGADTVRLATSSEKPDDWIWLKKLPERFLNNRDLNWKKVTENDSFADKGFMLGVKIDEKPGVVNCAMTGIMSMIAKVKKELKEATKNADPAELQRLKMMYQSVKGARNAGSVDYSQRIVLKTPDGRYSNTKIGEFVDKAIEKYGSRIEKIDGTEFEIADIKDSWTAISVNKNGKTEIKRVKQAVRHRWKGELVKITTKSGFTVVTPNHSVFTVRNNKIEEISASEINDDTLLVHSEIIPTNEKRQNADLIKEKSFENCFAIPPKNIEFVEPSSDYVYDIGVEDNENFLDANGGILLHNTHGILSAPGVSGRQFNLWGAATITTKGQMILADSLEYLEKRGIRVVYGDSIGADTDIILKDKGLIKIVNIKKLFSQYNNKIYKKGNHEYKTLDNTECLSVNKNGICEWKKANFIKRHPYDRDILNIQTQRGKISVTMNHSLYTISNGLREVLCKNIKEENANIVHLSKYNDKGKKIKINALKPLIEFNDELNIWLNIPVKQATERLLKYHQPRSNFKGGTSKKRFIRMKILDGIKLYKTRIITDKDIQNAFISSYNGKGKIPVIYELDKDFARILGAYISEGSIYIRRRKGMTKEGALIFVCGHNVQSLKELQGVLAKKFKRNFNITSAGIDKNGENFRIQGNSSITYLLKFVLDCGQGSKEKKVSPYVLSSTKNVQKAFFDEYIRGDGHYATKNRVNPLLEITTKSKKLAEGLMLLALNLKYGYPSVRFRKDKSVFEVRFVQYNRNSIEYKDLTGLIPKNIENIKTKDGYVYDISVQENNNFVCANGLILAHNTDGIYLGCSRSMGNIPKLPESLGLSIDKDNNSWLTKPDIALDAINECNNKWQKDLNYPDFELEPEIHDGMIFIKHKNYLIFDTKNGNFQMNTKGNNFKGSDKANIARKVLKDIMIEVLKENFVWDDEEKARKKVKESIVNKTQDAISKLDLSKVDLIDLTLVQSVQPAKRYKPNMDGSLSTFAKRTMALEKLLGRPIKSRTKFKFVVTKKSLPGIIKPSKSGVKPIDYMYPLELLKNKSEIDLDWYKKMVENYIQGAFGLSNIEQTEQLGLDAWM